VSRLEPLDLAEIPGLEEIDAFYNRIFGFVPNGLRIMGRRPAIVEGFLHLRRVVVDPATSEVDPEFKDLIGHISSKAGGCRYCQAHTIFSADRADQSAERLAAIWEYASSDLFSDAEKAALDFALAASGAPNTVTDEQFAELQTHWDDGQIVEILAVIALYGFLNRWNDTLATQLETPSRAAAEKIVGPQGWQVEKHA
jgi:uncharacterized peroxidase-related enzyme